MNDRESQFFERVIAILGKEADDAKASNPTLALVLRSNRDTVILIRDALEELENPGMAG